MKCPSCGADTLPGTRCGYCGSRLPLTAELEKKAVFGRIRSSVEYQQRDSVERRARLPRVGAVQKALLIVFFVIFIGGSLMMCLIALGMAGVFGLFGGQLGDGPGAMLGLVPLLFAAVPLGFVVLGIFLWRMMRERMDALERGPVESLAVIVVDKRTHVSGGGDSSTSTRYYATCETEEGRRHEYLLWDGALYGRLSAGDAGILFVRADCGLDFDRVPT